MSTIARFAQISDDELILELRRLAACECNATATLIACLAEVDRRRLYLERGYTSMFKYCTDVLHLSEDATFARIEAARAARRYPGLIDQLASGELTLTAVRLLAPHLTSSNHLILLAEARHKGTKEVQAIIARYRPLPPVPDAVRKLPEPKPAAAIDATRPSQTGSNASVPVPPMPLVPSLARRDAIAPLSAHTYKVQFTIRKEVQEKLRQLQDLLRHQIPKGDLAVIFERGVELQLDAALKKRAGAVERPRSGRPANQRSRNIPSHVRRAVWARDGGACAFVASDGRRCGERGRVEYHHVVPFAAGGATTVDNLEMRCAAHNRYEAEQYFGEAMLFSR